MSKSLVELKKAIEIDIEITEKLIEMSKNTEHPQEKESLHKDMGRLEALKDVLAYCNNGSKYFRKMKDWEDIIND